MQQDILKSFNEFSNKTLEVAKALGEVNSKLIDKTLKQQMKAADLYVEGSLRQAKLIQETKDMKDYFANQTALFEEYSSKFVDLAKANVSLAQEAGVEYKALLEKGLKTADTAAKSVAKKAVEAAA
ncbi:MAG: phasin family protein [Arenicellales bacterium]|nr:phasin family protein [Arenicellales bacterium]